MFRRLNQFLLNIEWRWSLGSLMYGFVIPFTSFALPVWATRATGMLGDYAPASWVAVGFLGLVLYSACFFTVALARTWIVRAKYDQQHLSHSGSSANPMEKMFEKKRIFLNDFCLPSGPNVHDKYFIDCEVIGPANIVLASGNRVDESLLPFVDAVVMPIGSRPLN